MTENRKKAVVGLKKARGQVDRVIAMLEAGDYCIDVMQQNMAAIGILKKIHESILEDHLHSCFLSAMASDDAERKQEMVEEILQVVKLYNR